jgi:hypothetical protein
MNQLVHQEVEDRIIEVSNQHSVSKLTSVELVLGHAIMSLFPPALKQVLFNYVCLLVLLQNIGLVGDLTLSWVPLLGQKYRFICGIDGLVVKQFLAEPKLGAVRIWALFSVHVQLWLLYLIVDAKLA